MCSAAVVTVVFAPPTLPLSFRLATIESTESHSLIRISGAIVSVRSETKVLMKHDEMESCRLHRVSVCVCAFAPKCPGGGHFPVYGHSFSRPLLPQTLCNMHRHDEHVQCSSFQVYYTTWLFVCQSLVGMRWWAAFFFFCFACLCPHVGSSLRHCCATTTFVALLSLPMRDLWYKYRQCHCHFGVRRRGPS